MIQEILKDYDETFGGFEAIYYPSDSEDLSKAGFKTAEEAWEYARGFQCNSCKKEKNQYGTSCLCEWGVHEVGKEYSEKRAFLEKSLKKVEGEAFKEGYQQAIDEKHIDY